MTDISALICPVGPFAADSNRIAPTKHAGIHSPCEAELFLSGEIWSEGQKPCLQLRIGETADGRCLWSNSIECGSALISDSHLAQLAEQIVTRISGDWGVICNRIARGARTRKANDLTAHEAVALARQYLTHFHFEQLERCVCSLRRAVIDTDEACIPATLAVVLSMACAVEPRWSEPLNRAEIHALAARASRLDPEAAWTRLALAVSAMIDGHRDELVEMAKRAHREAGTPVMLLGALGSLLCFQSVEMDRKRSKRHPVVGGQAMGGHLQPVLLERPRKKCGD
ncbi:MAG: hypothetical protein ACO3RV_08780, partial [Luteolibacter sp.]